MQYKDTNRETITLNTVRLHLPRFMSVGTGIYLVWFYVVDMITMMSNIKASPCHNIRRPFHYYIDIVWICMYIVLVNIKVTTALTSASFNVTL